jgi:hypothetical protein
MAQRGYRSSDPEERKGGVRGTHGLGDKERRSKRARANVATQGGSASPTGGSRKGGSAKIRKIEIEEDEEALTDPAYREERNLETVHTHGPGPNDEGRGTARKAELEKQQRVGWNEQG